MTVWHVLNCCALAQGKTMEAIFFLIIAHRVLTIELVHDVFKARGQNVTRTLICMHSRRTAVYSNFKLIKI